MYRAWIHRSSIDDGFWEHTVIQGRFVAGYATSKPQQTSTTCWIVWLREELQDDGLNQPWAALEYAATKMLAGTSRIGWRKQVCSAARLSKPIDCMIQVVRESSKSHRETLYRIPLRWIIGYWLHKWWLLIECEITIEALQIVRNVLLCTFFLFALKVRLTVRYAGKYLSKASKKRKKKQRKQQRGKNQKSRGCRNAHINSIWYNMWIHTLATSSLQKWKQTWLLVTVLKLRCPISGEPQLPFLA